MHEQLKRQINSFIGPVLDGLELVGRETLTVAKRVGYSAKHIINSLSRSSEEGSGYSTQSVGPLHRNIYAYTTLAILERRKDSNLSKNKQGFETYRGKVIIGRDRPINGGILLGIFDRQELIIVDDKEDHKLRQAYEHVKFRYLRAVKLGKIERRFNTISEQEEIALDVVEAMARHMIRLSRKYSEYIAYKYGKKQQAVYLSHFFETGGTCRHINLLAGYLLEKLVKDEDLEDYQLPGSVSVDKCIRSGDFGHLWVRYLPVNGKPVILDGLNGTESGHIDDSNFWKYRRPNETLNELKK